ncbi:opsin, ultraviolet-sensitive-like [Pollicipes pollicipes]|uniref:LOW QUALITY PROTEIN: opsin, ultraviolet-sensitive-like n=1 Tax=Pollicipes pollicipes TaxID=41117 RepID=UPI0018857722|nr:LOW QUALITY PROTEIN: opsin, ultraviolet-sensitive-like [Pollicipes pollicipes]XP_037075689.1 opsin, ultraviolet-sensitive-like [Pollicipes pollicipes]
MEAWHNLTRLPLVQSARSNQKMMGWNTPEEYLAYVDPHWLTFPAPDPMAHYILGVVYIIFHIVSVLGNGSVLWIFLTTKTLRTPSNMFIVNLAFMDFFMMLKAPIMIYNSFQQGPALGWVGCAVFATVGSISGAGSSCANALIAFDRYKKISDPMGSHFKMTAGKASLLILGMWIYITPWFLLPLLEMLGRYQPEGFLTTCGGDYLTESWTTKAYVIGIFTTVYAVPVLSIIIFYYRIFAHVAEHEQNMKAQAAKMNVKNLRAGDNSVRQELRVAKVGVMLTSLYLFAWTPYAVVAFMGAFGAKARLTPLMSMIPACTCKTAACLDPFAYAISHPAYRQELEKRWPCLGVREKQETPSTQEGAVSEAAA